MNNVLIAFFVVLVCSISVPISYAQIIGHADVLLTDIQIEPADPKPGDSLSIQSIVYNAGLQSTKSVTDVVTVGYFVNGDLVKIDELPDILPGIENSVLISSGPILNAPEGNLTITVILNYHNTLSPLTDNLSNNIVQKIFSIGEPRPSVVVFEVFQEYLPETKRQKITIDGNLSSVNNSFLPDTVNLQLGKFSEDIPVNIDGLFQFSKTVPLFDNITPVTIVAEQSYPLLRSSYTTNVYPISLDSESILSFQIQNPSDLYNFQDSSATIAIFDESYNIIKKIDTDEVSSGKTFDTVFTSLPAGTYITEIYFEGRFLQAITTSLKENVANTDSLLFPETSKVKFQVLEDDGREPISDALVQNWIYSLKTDENGFTDWINVLPTLNENDSYTAKTLLPNGKIFWSDPFFIEYGEQKVIQMVVDS